MHTAHHICLILCVFLLDTSVYLKAYGEVFWLQLFTSMAWNWWVLKIANLQSCTKSVKNLHSLTHRMPVPYIWWSVLFIRDQKWSRHTLTLFSWGRGGSVCSYVWFQELHLKARHMPKSIFLHIFVPRLKLLNRLFQKKSTPYNGGLIFFTPPPPHPHICLVICVPLPRKHISLLNLPGRGTLSLGICVSLLGKHKTLMIILVIILPLPEIHIPPDMCSPTKDTHILSDMCSPAQKTHIPSGMCSSTKDTHILSDICFPTQETHIPSDMCTPSKETHNPIMCSPSWETRNPSVMCSPTRETCIPSDMGSPTQETHIPRDMFFSYPCLNNFVTDFATNLWFIENKRLFTWAN